MLFVVLDVIGNFKKQLSTIYVKIKKMVRSQPGKLKNHLNHIELNKPRKFARLRYFIYNVVAQNHQIGGVCLNSNIVVVF